MRYRVLCFKYFVQYDKTDITFSKADVYGAVLRHISRTWLLLLGIFPYHISFDNFEDTEKKINRNISWWRCPTVF